MMKFTVDSATKHVDISTLIPPHVAFSVVASSVLKEMFQDVYSSIEKGTDAWNALDVKQSELYDWDEKSTYIHHPPFFQSMVWTTRLLQFCSACFTKAQYGGRSSPPRPAVL